MTTHRLKIVATLLCLLNIQLALGIKCVESVEVDDDYFAESRNLIDAYHEHLAPSQHHRIDGQPIRLNYSNEKSYVNCTENECGYELLIMEGEKDNQTLMEIRMCNTKREHLYEHCSEIGSATVEKFEMQVGTEKRTIYRKGCYCREDSALSPCNLVPSNARKPATTTSDKTSKIATETSTRDFSCVCKSENATSESVSTGPPPTTITIGCALVTIVTIITAVIAIGAVTVVLCLCRRLRRERRFRENEEERRIERENVRREHAEAMKNAFMETPSSETQSSHRVRDTPSEAATSKTPRGGGVTEVVSVGRDFEQRPLRSNTSKTGATPRSKAASTGGNGDQSSNSVMDSVSGMGEES